MIQITIGWDRPSPAELKALNDAREHVRDLQCTEHGEPLCTFLLTKHKKQNAIAGVLLGVCCDAFKREIASTLVNLARGFEGLKRPHP